MTVFKYSVALAAVALTVISSADAADRAAREWLERMSESLATRNYDGRYLHVRNARAPETMRIIHRVEKGKVTERLVSLDGSGREIIRNQNEVICYLPDRRTVLTEKRTDERTLMATVPLYNEQLEEHYSIERGAFKKALGRRTQIILVQPRDESAMPLMSQLCDRNGNVIEQIVFAELNFRERIPLDEVKPAVDGKDFRWVRQDAQEPRLANVPLGWNMIRLPSGFRLTTWRLQIIAGSSVPVRHLVLSDGLASVSVFIEPRSPQTEAMRGLAKVGAAFAYSRDLDGHQVTAVGEVPAATVEAIAEAVTKEDPALAPVAREQQRPQ
jgi:sigma-E factor negative regulatory protein RseB